MSEVIVDIGKAMGFSGRYWAVVHDGKGNELRRTSPGPNALTIKFFNDLMSGNNPTSGAPVVGSGNAAASESDTVLDTYLGKCNTVEVVSGSDSYDDTPDANGYVYQRQTYVAHYLPGRLGSGTVNVAEAGLASGNISAVTSATQLYSRGLLVNSGGSPVSIPYDAANEYLDVYWEFTRWVKAEASGVVSLNLLGTPTNHNYVIRPSNWRKQAASNNNLWEMPGADSNGIGMNAVRCTFAAHSGQASQTTGASSGPIGTIAQIPAGTMSAATSVTIQPLTANKERDWIIAFGPAVGNIAGGIGALHFVSKDAGNNLRGSSWQMSLDPKVDKTATRNFTIRIRATMGNYP